MFFKKDSRIEYLENELIKLNKKVNDLSESSYYKYNKPEIYAVQGVFPHIIVSKYEYISNDSFNFCLRSDSGNLCLLPKELVFADKTDAILYQTDLIQKSIEKENK